VIRGIRLNFKKHATRVPYLSRSNGMGDRQRCPRIGGVLGHASLGRERAWPTRKVPVPI